jgi:hypothetical protein
MYVIFRKPSPVPRRYLGPRAGGLNPGKAGPATAAAALLTTLSPPVQKGKQNNQVESSRTDGERN